MNPSEHVTQIPSRPNPSAGGEGGKEGMHKWTRFLEILGAILLVVFIGLMIFSFFGRQGTKDEDGGENAVVLPLSTKEELMRQMSAQVEVPPVVSEDERERLFEEMSQQAPAVSGGGTGAESDAPAAPSGKAPTAEERAKMLEMMNQKAPQ